MLQFETVISYDLPVTICYLKRKDQGNTKERLQDVVNVEGVTRWGRHIHRRGPVSRTTYVSKGSWIEGVPRVEGIRGLGRRVRRRGRGPRTSRSKGLRTEDVVQITGRRRDEVGESTDVTSRNRSLEE